MKRRRSLFKNAISILLVLSMLLSNIAYAAPITLVPGSTKIIEVDTEDQEIGTTEYIQTEIPDEPRSINELLNLDTVNISSTDEVESVWVGEGSDLTSDEIQMLLFGETSTIADDMFTYEEVSWSELGITEVDVEYASYLHGSQDVFQSQINALLRDNGSLESLTRENLVTLICHGYTYSQAQAALQSSNAMGLSIETLCQAKEKELTSENTDDEDYEAEDSPYELLAIRLGLPCSLVDEYMLTHDGDAGTLLEECCGIENTDATVAPYKNQISTADSGSQVVYTPDQVLDDPFGFQKIGKVETTLSTGNFIYSETDLSIPGINGLDLNFVRQYDSSSAMALTPTGHTNTNLNSSTTIALELQGYVSYDGGKYNLVSDWTDYTFSSASTQQNLIAALNSGDYGPFTTAEYEDAVYAKMAFEAEVTGWVYGVRDRNGNKAAMRLRPVLVGTGRFTSAFENLVDPYNYLIDEFGLGHGWRLGISGIETYYSGFDYEREQRLITSDGHKYKVDFSSFSGLEDYTLTDIKLTQSGNGYSGASYTLLHADGRKEYFDANGRNIAIMDRFGNTIKLEYSYKDTAKRQVSQIKITDTVGNIIIYKDNNITSTLQIPGLSRSTGQYNSQWTLSLNGEIVRTYYSYTPSSATAGAYVRSLKVVDDELSQHTIYRTSSLKQNFNCFVTNPATNDGICVYGVLGTITYPSGAEFKATTGYTSTTKKNSTYGYAGYQQIRRLNSIETTYEVASEDYLFYLNERDFEIGDVTGYYSYLDENDRYTTIETSLQSHQILNDEPNAGMRFAWNAQTTEHIYDEEGLLRKRVEKPHKLAQDEDVKTDDDFALTSDEPIGTSKITEYTYNSDHLPTSINVKNYNVGSSSYMAQNYSYTYDKKGNVLSETLPNGNTTSYTYSSDYNLLLTKSYKQNASTTITQTNTLSTDKKSIVSSTTTSNDILVGKADYTYDSKGRLTGQKVYRDANTYTQQQYAYGNDALVTETKTINVKDVNGNLVDGTPGYDAGVIAKTSSYNTRGWLTSDTDANGNQTQIEYDGTGRITKVTNPDGTFATYAYAYGNGTGVNTVSATNEHGDTLEYRYDPFGHQIETYDPTSGKILSQASYDSLGRKYLSTSYRSDGTSLKTYYWYDLQDRLIESGIRNSDGTNTKLESYTYLDASGKTTHTVYGETGAPTSVETTYVDNMGNTVKTGRKLGSTEYTDIYSYDYLGNNIQTRTAYTGGLGGSFTTKTEYNYAGQPTKVTDALNQSILYAYDLQGNRVSATDAKGVTVTSEYDALGRRLKVTQPFTDTASSVTRYTYDPAGNVLSTAVTNNLPGEAESCAVTDYAYNSRNWLTRVGAHVSDTQTNYTQYYYDAAGSVLRMYTGLTAPLTISGLDQVSGGSTGYQVTKYAYDRFGNQTSATDPLNQTETAVYDISGLPLTRTDRNGNVTTYTYDGQNRLTGQAVATPDHQGDVTLSYTYALNGRTLSVSDGSQTTSYTYDSLGRVLTETTGTTVKQYAYNLADLRTSFTLKTGSTQQLSNAYTYDALGRLTQVSSGGVTASYTYDANGNRASMSYNNGLQETYAYNQANLVTQVLNKKGTSVLSQYDYAYDLSGQQVSKTDHTGKVTSYTYDGQGQLTGETETLDGVQVHRYSYQYDPAYNRVQATLDGKTVSYVTDANNRLLSSTDEAGATTYTYDANGNTKTVSYAGLDKTVQYGYDGLDRQTSVDTISYAYYPGGLRSSKTVGGTTTTYVWDGDQLVLEQTGDTVKKYIRGLNLIAQQEGTALTYYLYNAHGDVVQLCDESGDVLRSYDYDAFGVQKASAAEDTNSFRYCGEYFDGETDSYYLRARNYVPTLGRFTQEDTYKGLQNNSLSLNYYTYCWNSPLIYIDSTGNFPMLSPRLYKKGELRDRYTLANIAASYFGIDTAALGAPLLNMEADSNGIYHADYNCWQAIFGYNNFYDHVFDSATSMSKEQFTFTSEGQDYALWFWKGDYLNLGAGAEAGIYKRMFFTPHWIVDKDEALRMSLSLKDNKGNIIIDNYEDTHWWLTGFNPKYQYVSAENLTATYTVYFKNKDMFTAFYKKFGENGSTPDSRWMIDPGDKEFKAIFEF